MALASTGCPQAGRSEAAALTVIIELDLQKNQDSATGQWRKFQIEEMAWAEASWNRWGTNRGQ